jgi:sulfur relay (sulfurtransferase) DsrC/TusE family protein
MSIGDEKLDVLLDKLAPVILPPAEYPPADVVRDTPREEIIERIKHNASIIGMDLTDDHWEVIDFVFDLYVYCCETKDPGYLGHQKYWKYIDCISDQDCEQKLDAGADEKCQYGQLSTREATKAYRIYRILLKAFKDKGAKKHLYKLFPYGPLFTIHLLAQLPRLIDDVDPHYGTAY